MLSRLDGLRTIVDNADRRTVPVEILNFNAYEPELASVTPSAKKDDAPSAVQAAIVKVAGSSSISGGGVLILTIYDKRQQRVNRYDRRRYPGRDCS